MASLNSKRRKQKYVDKWETEFDWATGTPRDAYIAVCKLCNADINVSSSGKTALFQHQLKQKHKQHEKEQENQNRIFGFVKRTDNFEDKVVDAEIRWSVFAAEHD